MSKNKKYATVKMFFVCLFKGTIKWRGLSVDYCAIISAWGFLPFIISKTGMSSLSFSAF